MSLKLNLYRTTLRKKAARGFQGYPMATVIFYGPDDQRATKVAVGIVASEASDTEMSRWHSHDIDVRKNAGILEEIVKLVRRRNVKSLAMTEQILGCPHEEGVDYPSGDVCPQCPYWAGRPRPILDDDAEPAVPVFDMRAMEKTLASITKTEDADSALAQAQDIMWDAFDEKDRGRRIELARKALSISSDCADAYVLLAEEQASTLREAMDLFEKGVRAGERALGEKPFAEDAGHFWGLLETRPYMRARAGLANCLREAGKVDEAIDHYQELLRLNPNDNQGIRHMLTQCLVTAQRDREAADLLDRYPGDITADYLYSAALVAYRIAGEAGEAASKLGDAMRRNPYVPAYLLGLKRMPRRFPSHFSIGSTEEAASYADLHGENWKNTKGALEWLKRESKK